MCILVWLLMLLFVVRGWGLSLPKAFDEVCFHTFFFSLRCTTSTVVVLLCIVDFLWPLLGWMEPAVLLHVAIQCLVWLLLLTASVWVRQPKLIFLRCLVFVDAEITRFTHQTHKISMLWSAYRNRLDTYIWGSVGLAWALLAQVRWFDSRQVRVALLTFFCVVGHYSV